MTEKETILTKTYDLLKFSIPILSKFPRDQKFLLGDQFQKLLTEILDAFMGSNRGFEPCFAGRFLEQQCQQLPLSESQQQQPGQP